MKATDLTGLRFGRLTVLGIADKVNGYIHWQCLCDCGTKKSVDGSNLTSGRQKSCGCLNTEKRIARVKTHGLSKTKLYKVWVWMLTRCYNASANRYQHYGGRGIFVCDSWKEDFKTFYDDMFATYRSGLQLDRIDVDGPYSKDNCRWVTPSQNGRNKRESLYILDNGVKKHLLDWAEENNISRSAAYKKYYKGKLNKAS